jgi:DMSO reductase anchor subunit
MPPSHPVTKWGLVALGLGVVLLIFPTLLGLRHTTAVDVVGVLSILGSVGLLVSRLSSDSGDDDGPDDGAVV